MAKKKAKKKKKVAKKKAKKKATKKKAKKKAKKKKRQRSNLVKSPLVLIAMDSGGLPVKAGCFSRNQLRQVMRKWKVFSL